MYAGGYCIVCGNQKAAGPLSQPTGDLTELLCGCEKIFKFSMGEKVRVNLAGTEYTGEIISRLESHTGGIRYAVFANYKHAKEGYWFSEKELIAA